MTTLAEHLAAATARFQATGVDADDARHSAWVLAGRVLGRDRAGVLSALRDAAPSGFAAAFDSMVARRAAREPVAYITGEREFYGRTFVVTPDVLIPRPETELIIDIGCRFTKSVKRHPMSFSIVDVGTGSGCLAVTLALECPDARVIATDTSSAALDVARLNARRLGAIDRVDFRHGAFLAGLDTPVDLIVSNPPYVPELDRPGLAPEVTAFEPAGALFAGADGLDVIRALLPVAAAALAPGGWLVLEIGAGQDAAVRRLIDQTPGLSLERIETDLQQIPRVVVARRGHGAGA